MEYRTKGFALKLSFLIDSGAISAEQHIPWCDKIIEQENEPPHWIIELALKRGKEQAIQTLQSYAFAEPFTKLEMGFDHTTCALPATMRSTKAGG